MPFTIGKKEQIKDWHLLEFSAPILEHNYYNDSNKFVIKGTAINETTTKNNHKYIAEELEKAAPGLIGRKMLVDHDNRVESIKGVVTNAIFDPSSRSIKFEAEVMDKNIQEMIKDGRLSNVSIGAFAKDLLKEEATGAYIATGMEIVELSFVAVPGDENADFAMAMQGNYNLKESLSIVPKDIPNTNKMADERRLNTMSEENNNLLQEALTEKNKLLEANQKVIEELNVLKAEKHQNKISEYKKLCSEKNLKEKDVSKLSDDVIDLLIEQVKEIKVEAKKEMKSEVSQSADLSGIDNFVIERSESGNGYAMWAKPDVAKLDRLHRSLPSRTN